jgi:hypothetical protein
VSALRFTTGSSAQAQPSLNLTLSSLLFALAMGYDNLQQEFEQNKFCQMPIVEEEHG